MSENERVKQIRKAENLTLDQFGARIGMKKSSISDIENGRRSLTEQSRLLICREFNVNEHWLRTGSGEMTVASDTFSLDEFARKRGASELDLAIVKLYFSLPPAVRADMLEKLASLIDAPEADAANQETGKALSSAAASKIAAVPARLMPDPDRAALEQEADEFAAMAREQFILKKKREFEALSAKSSDAG